METRKSNSYTQFRTAVGKETFVLIGLEVKVTNGMCINN